MRVHPLTAAGLACLAAVLSLAIPAARADQVSKGAPGEEKSAAGLKEALRVGVGNTVDVTGKVDGYFRNEAIKILMPKQLQSLEKGLRAVGYGPKVDEFVLSMNRAAERAAPRAKDIFVGAIGQMTFTDASQILTGGETAATDYFKTKTSDELTAAFRPVVEKTMDETGVTRQYKALVSRFEAIPFAKSQSFDIDQYVVSRALDGLFTVLAGEERKIRKDPAARVTSLLRDVFGR